MSWPKGRDRRRWARGFVAIALTISRVVGAQTVVADPCLGEKEVVAALERAVRKFREHAPLSARVEQTICSDKVCVVHFDLAPASPECSSDFRSSLVAPSKSARPQIASFACEMARGECREPAGPPLGEATPPSETTPRLEIATSIAESTSGPDFDTCVERAVAMVAASTPCPRLEPISDPVAPPPPPAARMGFDLGIGWQLGNASALQRPLLAVGTSMDWKIVPWLTVGGRIGYLAVAGRAVDRDGDGLREADARSYHAFESAARLRVRIGGAAQRLELETRFGHRLTLGGAPSGHLTLGAGPILYLSRFGLGLQYVRALSNVGVDHAVFLTTQRNSSLDVDGDTWHDARRARGRGPRVGLGMHVVLTGWGFAEHAGPMLPGAAIELPVLLVEPLVAVARYDFLWFPALDAPGFVTQTVLGGLQYLQIGALPVGLGALVGHAVVDGKAPRVVDGGPVADASVFYWLDQLGVHLGLHGRFGLTDHNRDLRAVYASLGARQIF